jgi:hypothetical protein
VNLYLRFPKATKTDIIRGFLDTWDPLRMREQAGYMFYNYEADVIAQTIRKNSKPERISKLVHDLVANKMIEEGVQLGIDQGSCDRIAVAMITSVKNMR